MPAETRRSWLSLAALATAFAVAPAQQPTYRTAQDPNTDPVLSSLPGGVMFDIPGILPDFVLSGGGQFVELPNGTARLTGRVLSYSQIYSAFLVDVQFSGRTGTPPAGSPVLGMRPGAYAPAGPIDPNQFHYYTQASGTLNGVRNYEGARVALQLTGPAVQVGVGANNRNGNLGLLGTFAVTVTQQPPTPFGATSTALLCAELIADRPLFATHVMVDPTHSPLTFDRGMVLPGIGTDYFFVPAATFTEFQDGHGELRGTLARIAQLNDQWQCNLTLNQRVDPGQAGWPPAGSPVLGLLPQSYVGNGGPCDPASWHYYQQVTGTLTGAGSNAGGRIDLTGNLPLQVGGGADQANTYVGCYCRFTGQVVSQPGSHTIALTGTPELHVLTGTFPVLPFPSLDVPPVNPSLPTLTDQGIVLSGQNLAWIVQVIIGPTLITSDDPQDWYRGYYHVIDDQHIEIHPVPGMAPGTVQLGVLNPVFLSNHLNLDLVAPGSPVLYSESSIRTGRTQHVFLHKGGLGGPVLSAFAFSGSLLPSTVPGIVQLGIGNQMQNLVVVPGSFLHDPATGIAGTTLGPIPAAMIGAQLHFQGAMADLGGATLPLHPTNVWTVQYVP